MSWKTLPVDGLIRTLLTLLLGFGALTAESQEQQETGAKSDAEPKTVETPARAESNSTPAAGPINKNSPFDYQASEEISQDLSVSFPVDI